MKLDFLGKVEQHIVANLLMSLCHISDVLTLELRNLLLRGDLHNNSIVGHFYCREYILEESLTVKKLSMISHEDYAVINVR